MTFPEPLKGVKDDLHADQKEEDSVCESRKRVDLAVPVGIFGIWPPLAHYCCRQTDCETCAVKQHVNAVSKQSKRAADEAVEELDKHKGQVETIEGQLVMTLDGHLRWRLTLQSKQFDESPFLSTHCALSIPASPERSKRQRVANDCREDGAHVCDHASGHGPNGHGHACASVQMEWLESAYRT